MGAPSIANGNGYGLYSTGIDRNNYNDLVSDRNNIVSVASLPAAGVYGAFVQYTKSYESKGNTFSNLNGCHYFLNQDGTSVKTLSIVGPNQQGCTTPITAVNSAAANIESVTDSDLSLVPQLVPLNPIVLLSKLSPDLNLTALKSLMIADTTSLSAELLINGRFDSETGWLPDSGWTVANGIAHCSGSSQWIAARHAVNFLAGHMYAVQFDVLDYVSGSVAVLIHGSRNVASATVSANGTYARYLVAPGAPSHLWIQAYPGFVGDINNVSVKEVTGGSFSAIIPSFPSLPVYPNNAAAVAGGLKPGMLYRTGRDPDEVAVAH
jgi:hypothetical protein